MSIKNIKQQKVQIRSVCKKYRLNLYKTQKEKMDIILQKNFLDSSYYNNAELLLAFAAKDIEVSTDLIMDTAMSTGKKLALPKCKAENQMDFYYVSDKSQLVKGFYDLWEPDTEKCELVQDFKNAVCLVPGLAFDREGYRIGFGKGYYDRFLQNFLGTTVGICYSKCIENLLPRGYYDRPIDAVITEKYTIDIQSDC